MKIAHVVFDGVNDDNGRIRKAAGQIRAWRSRGHEVRLFAVSRSETLWEGLADLPVEVVEGFTKAARLLRSRALMAKVLDWQPDIAYVRWSSNFPGLGGLLKRAPCVFELNTYDVGEFKLTCPNRIQYYYHLATRGRLLRRTHGLAAVTNEIAGHFAVFGKPTAVIANGIVLSGFPEMTAPSNPEPRLVFIGAPRLAWHGVDKVLSLAGHFRRWRFDVIGPAREDLGSMGIPDNVFVHGWLGRPAYLEILARADVALGTLALHRNDMNEACPLKVREYLACGIPTIVGYKDTDFPEPVPFLLGIPNSEDNVLTHRGEIKKFVNESIGKRVPRDRIRHMDVALKEKRRLEFMEGLLRGRA